MSKIVNIPGTSTFIPLDDLVNVKIHASLDVANRLAIPENPDDPFKISIIPSVSLTIVTQYLDDAESEGEDEDEDDDSTSKKKKTKAKSTEESDDTLKVSSVLAATHDILSSVQEGEDIFSSKAFNEGDEEFQKQTRIRLKKYAQNLEHQIQRDELIQELNNTNPAAAEAVLSTDETEGDEEELEVEKDTAPSPFDSNRAILEALVPSTPSQTKLQELKDYLQADAEKQDKRVKWLIDAYESTDTKLTNTDAYKFCDSLEKMGIDESEVAAIREKVKNLILEIAEVMNT